MKITGRKSQALGAMNPLAGPPAADPPAEAPSAVPLSDQVSLASTTQIRQLGQVARAMPDVRIEKVQELRLAIDDGSYHVESEKLARRVVDEAINELLMREGRSMLGR